MTALVCAFGTLFGISLSLRRERLHPLAEIAKKQTFRKEQKKKQIYSSYLQNIECLENQCPIIFLHAIGGILEFVQSGEYHFECEGISIIDFTVVLDCDDQ